MKPFTKIFSSIAILLFALLLPTQSRLFAQETTDVPLSNRWSFRAIVTPQIQHRSLIADAAEVSFATERNQNEIAQFGFRAGLTAEYRFSEQWSVSAGLAFADRGFQTRLHETKFIQPTASQGSPNLVLPEQSFLSYRFAGMDVPIQVIYRFAQSQSQQEVSAPQWSFFAALGATPSVVVQRTKTYWVRSENVWSSSQTTRNRGFERFAVFVEASVGAEYALSRHIGFRIAANAGHAVSAVNTSLALREYLYSGGVECGIVITP